MHKNIMDTELIDIRTIKIDPDLPKSEKIAEYIRQVKTPHQYRCGKYTITEEFTANGPNIEKCLKSMAE